MKKLVLALTLGLLVAVGVLLLQLQRPAPRTTGNVAKETEEPAPDPTGSVQLLAPSAPQAALANTGPERSPALLSLEQEDFALDDAQWIDVSVRFPGALAADDRPELVAISSMAELDEWDVNRIGQYLDLSDDFASALEEGAHWSCRPLEVHVRAPAAEGTKVAVLFVQSRYLYVEPVRVALPARDPVELAPALGAYVTGRCTLPPGSAERGASAAAIELAVDGRTRASGFIALRDSERRDVRVHEDLTFELRALPPDRVYSVEARCAGLVGHFEGALELLAGESRELEIPFRLGATLRGRVLGPDGAPIGGADVARFGRPANPWVTEASVRTNDDGHFELVAVPEGKTTVHASKAGWLTGKSEPIDVRDGDLVEGLEVLLATGRGLAGRVSWPDGAPAANAEVEVYVRRSPFLGGSANARTDDGGRFALGGLESGSLEVYASCLPRSADLARLGLARASDDEIVTGRWMAVATGVAPEDGELALRLEQPLAVTGVVVDETGTAVASFHVDAEPTAHERGGPDAVRHAADGTDGAFRIGVFYPGDWRVSARADGHTPCEAALVRVPQLAALELVLPRAAAIRGTVVDPFGASVAGASVSIEHADEGLRFPLGGEDGVSDDEGRFTLDDVTGASVSLVARHASWAASEPVTVDLTPGAGHTDVVLHLRAGARVTGEVFDAQGRPEHGLNVLLGGLFLGFGGEQSTATDRAGRFAFEHVTPGKVTFTVMPTEEELVERMQAAEDESEMLGLLGNVRSATVDVVDEETVHVVLGARPVKPVRVHGRVTEADRALEGVSVLAVAEGGTLFQGMKLAKTDGGGHYELVLDRPGDYTFGVDTTGEPFGGLGIQFPVEVPEVDELERDLELPLASVSGRVLAPDGGPASAVPVRLARQDGLFGLEDLDDASWLSTGNDGSFAFVHLDRGRYVLFAGGSAARFGELDRGPGTAIVGDIEVRADRAIEDLEVRLAATGKLAGRVRDESGRPVVGAAIHVRDARGLGSNVTSCRTDAAGRFTHDGLAPGAATALARTSTRASAESAPVEIRAGETSSVELVLAGGTFLVVSLVDGDGPVRARLSVVDEDGRRVDDLFSLEDLPQLVGQGLSSRERRVGPLAPGEYTCRALTADGREARESVRVEVGQTERRVELRLK